MSGPVTCSAQFTFAIQRANSRAHVISSQRLTWHSKPETLVQKSLLAAHLCSVSDPTLERHVAQSFVKTEVVSPCGSKASLSRPTAAAFQRAPLYGDIDAVQHRWGWGAKCMRACCAWQSVKMVPSWSHLGSPQAWSPPLNPILILELLCLITLLLVSAQWSCVNLSVLEMCSRDLSSV